MTHREIQTASLLMESGFHHSGASALAHAARIEVCLSISPLPLKDSQRYTAGDLSLTPHRRSGQKYPITHDSMPHDHFHHDCNPHSIPI
jgi:hypothetical protein